MQLGAETAVDAEELLVHNSSQRQGTERLHASIINCFRILVLALEFESEVIGQMATLVVAAQEPQSLRVVDLEAPQVKNTLDTEVSSIDIISEEKVSCFRGVTADFKEFHQVVILAVNVTTDGDGSIHLEQIGLRVQDLGTLLNDPKSLLFGQTTLTIEVLLEEGDIRLLVCLIFEELLVGRLGHGGSLHIYSSPPD